MPWQNEEVIYIKTGKGKEEVVQRKHGLSPKQRQLLIIFDGVKNLKEVRHLVKHDGFHDDLQALLRAAFITTKDAKSVLLDQLTPELCTAHPGPTAISATGAPASVSMDGTSTGRSIQVMLDAEHYQFDSLSKLKEFMIGIAQTYLGLLGASVIDYIRRVNRPAQLTLVVGQWHLALRESKHGGRLADSYLEQVRVALAKLSPEEYEVI